ncbi:MAG TPA: hypothetical protein VE953_26795 [Terriglobales bacterium]|nr:hypothetical protein [Terriglobales bacterium]
MENDAGRFDKAEGEQVSENGAPGFEEDIRPLFREKDREAMEGAFDLWDVEDVRANSGDILAALEGGAMPCDEPWPDDRVALLRRWVETGMAE